MKPLLILIVALGVAGSAMSFAHLRRPVVAVIAQEACCDTPPCQPGDPSPPCPVPPEQR